MYIPAPMIIDDRQQQHQFIEQFSFGVMLSDSLEASHLPFLLDRDNGELGTLYSHAARANRHCRALDGRRVLVVFNGPHAYISPTWYAGKPAVPTWNYGAVHATGTVTLLGADETHEVITQTLAKYEPALLSRQDVVTDALRDKLSSAIVGFKITLDGIEGKHKLGQHRSSEDQQGVAAGLATSGDHASMQLLEYMRQTGLGIGT